MTINQLEHRVLAKTVTALVCALAHDEAVQDGASQEELADLRAAWVSDAEEVVDEAELR